MRASLFVTRFNDTLFPDTGRAVVRLLERLGCEVDFPLEQTYCGQMHLNSGCAREGTALARRFARVIDSAEAVVTPSASCADMLRHHLAEGSPPVYERLRQWRARVRWVVPIAIGRAPAGGVAPCLTSMNQIGMPTSIVLRLPLVARGSGGRRVRRS